MKCLSLFSLLLLLIITSCNGPKTLETSGAIQPGSNRNSIEKPNNFPEDFLGIYKGDLKITSSNGTSEIPMEFHLSQTDTIDTFKYVIYYGEERSPRYYNLKRTHDPHLFLIDENNGIVLESAYANQTLYSTYEVAESLLNNTEIFYEDRMEFMIALSRIQDTSLTGNSSSALVKNYPLSIMQRATLYKIVD